MGLEPFAPSIAFDRVSPGPESMPSSSLPIQYMKEYAEPCVKLGKFTRQNSREEDPRHVPSTTTRRQMREIHPWTPTPLAPPHLAYTHVPFEPRNMAQDISGCYLN